MSARPLIRCQLTRRGAIRQYQGCTTAYPAGWNRLVPFAQPDQHLCLLSSRYGPKHEPRAVENRISERHPAASFVDAGQRHILIGYAEDRISRKQRRSAAILAQAEI